MKRCPKLTVQTEHLLDRRGPLGKCLGVIPLRSDCLRERTSQILARPQAADDIAEAISRLPAQFPPRAVVDVKPSDAWKHFPAAAVVLRFVFRNALPTPRVR